MTATSPPVSTDPGVPVPAKAAGVSPLRRLLNELTRSTSGFIGLCLVLLILLISLVGPMIMGTHVAGDPARAWEAPSGEHWLGLEGAGKDTLHLLVTGGRTVLMVGFLAAAITTVIAVAIGSLAGYFGGRFDAVMLQLTDIVMTVPQIVLLAVVGAFYKLDSPMLLAVIIGILSWPVLMRSIRAQVLSLKEREFVEAAQLLVVVRLQRREPRGRHAQRGSEPVESLTHRSLSAGVAPSAPGAATIGRRRSPLGGGSRVVSRDVSLFARCRI